MHTPYLDRQVIESILSISTSIHEMLHWWINNVSSFQVHLWTVLKFLTQWNLETAIGHQTINLLFKPHTLRLSPLTPPPLPSLSLSLPSIRPPHWVFFHQREVSMSCRYKGLSYTGPKMHRSMHAPIRLCTFVSCPRRANFGGKPETAASSASC